MFSERDYNRRPQQRGNSWKYSAVTTLILINIAVFILSVINPNLIGLGCISTDAPHQIWRLVTYQFFHASFGHIFWNMYGLWLFGHLLEPILGKTRMYILYLFSGILGGIFFLLANGPHSQCIGASGSEFGVMVATAVTFPYAEFSLIFPPIRMKLWVLALVYCGLEILYQVGGVSGGVAHLAHLGGALGGFLYMRRLLKHSNSQNPWSFFRRNREESQKREEPREHEYSYNPSEPFVFDQDELNRILDKMSRQGYAQLTSQEKLTLKRAGEELKRRKNSDD